jgi:thiamine-monophosphate kinase
MGCLGEKELINIFLAELPASQHMQNRFFESDAEVLNNVEGKLLFTTDEFSEEDFFRTDNPYRLGYNLAVATISDVLATGGTPYAYAHTVKVPSWWDKDYVTQMARGIADVLKTCGIGSIGGDIGVAPKQWDYTGICLGYVQQPVSRVGAMANHKIYMTGTIGAGNIEAAFSLYDSKQVVRLAGKLLKNLFSVRLNESKLIGQYASCCIDTSDGVLSALNILASLNGLGYSVGNLPYSFTAKMLCLFLGVPKEVLFIGECGEYELLFAVAPDKQEAFEKSAQSAKLKFTQIGEFTVNSNRWLKTDKKSWDLKDYTLSARDFDTKQEYLDKLLHLLENEAHHPISKPTDHSV